MTYIKHNRFLDVAILVVGGIRKFGSTYVVKGKYVNQGYVETFDLGTPTTVRISEAKIGDWLICRNPSEPCIRKSTWAAIDLKEHVICQ